MQELSEKSIDKALENGFIQNPGFCQYVTEAVGLAGDEHRYFWSRSDHPWARLEFVLPDAETGGVKTIVRDSETDVLIVLENKLTGARTALHIENKLANGKFTPHQPEMYPLRARKWVGLEKYKNYEKFFTVLIAPQTFYDSYPEMSASFDAYVPYEELTGYIPEIATYMR